jgi:hypothetical protein
MIDRHYIYIYIYSEKFIIFQSYVILTFEKANERKKIKKKCWVYATCHNFRTTLSWNSAYIYIYIYIYVCPSNYHCSHDCHRWHNPPVVAQTGRSICQFGSWLSPRSIAATTENAKQHPAYEPTMIQILLLEQQI